MSRLATLFVFILLAACTVTPPSTTGVTFQTASIPAAPDNITEALAALPTDNSRNQTLFAWAQDFLHQGDVDAANTLLTQLDKQSLSTDEKAQHALLQAQILLAQQEPDQALALIDGTLESIPHTDTNTANLARLSLLRADTLLLLGDADASLNQRINIDAKLDGDFRDYNEQMIWNALMQLPESSLTAGKSAASQQQQGWFTLANIVREPLTNISDQSFKIRQWQADWPNHPANQRPPAIVSLLLDNQQKSPTKVAVLLPISGALAEPATALRDGLLTAYYHNLNNSQAPELIFLDTESTEHIADLYQQAIDWGAQVVLGPLDKQQVDALRELGNFAVPTLTLNYSSDSTQPLPANFFEYGLAPEDQVEQLAEQAFNEGKHQAGLLYPNDEWGSRMAAAFTEAWQRLGGEIITSEAYDLEANNAVARLLQTNESQNRRRDVGRYTNQIVQFDERPRQDLDFVFLVANANQGRQIKPLFNFHFMSKLPIYSLSYIYQGEPNPTKDRDLNGIRFVDIPWVLNTDTSLHQQANAIWRDQHGNFRSLFAMGLDSYRLIEHLALLEADNNIRLPGRTGILSLKNQRIKRTLSWAVFSRGTAVSMPTVVSQRLDW